MRVMRAGRKKKRDEKNEKKNSLDPPRRGIRRQFYYNKIISTNDE